MINKLLGLNGYTLVKNKDLHRYLNLGYICCKETVRLAESNKLSVCEYVEQLWNQEGATQKVIDNIYNHGVFEVYPKSICEIGAGTGRYLEKVLKLGKPLIYESYEIDRKWAKWLNKKYGVISQKCDGKSLSGTKDNSIDFLHSHGVFVYLPFLISYNYFLEITRVIRNGGYLVFDAYVEECMSDEIVQKWLNSGQDYPAILPEQYLKDFFNRNMFKFIGSFQSPHGEGISKYFIFNKI